MSGHEHTHEHGRDLLAGLAPHTRDLRDLIPGVYEGFGRMHAAAFADGEVDRKTKELIAIAASLAFNCQNCMDGHIKKAIRDGATREEISETIAVTLGVAAAAVVDRSDLAGARLGMAFEDIPSKKHKPAP